MAADDAVAAAANKFVTGLAQLAQRDAIDQQRFEELTAEQTRLELAHDPDPVPPSWVTVTDGAALWRCVDFAEDLTTALPTPARLAHQRQVANATV